MLYTTCPTCGFFIAQKTLEYEKGKLDICSNPSLTEKEKEKKLSELLLGLKLRRYCCKMRIMSYKRLVYDILPIPKEN